MKRNALRQSFLITVTAAALAAPVACTNQVSLFDDDDTNPEACPVAQPSGDCTDEGLACSYGPRCGRVMVVCSSGQWDLSDRGRPDPTCDCPASIPADGDSCSREGMLCGYGDDFCGIPDQEAECRDGRWNTWFNSCNPPPPFECPQELPLEGTSCDENGWGTPGTCNYDEETPCGTQPVQADCSYDDVALQMVWAVEAPTCSSAQCDTYGHKDLCNADSGCRWLVPGCGSGTETVTPEGCYPVDDCTANGCSEGEGCTSTVHDPCAFSLCNACGAEAKVCLPVPDTGG